MVGAVNKEMFNCIIFACETISTSALSDASKIWYALIAAPETGNTSLSNNKVWEYTPKIEAANPVSTFATESPTETPEVIKSFVPITKEVSTNELTDVAVLLPNFKSVGNISTLFIK